MNIVTASEHDTEEVARTLAGRLRPGTVVALNGDLGAGKTCFVRGLARGLRLNPSHVSSPTFVIEHRYESLGSVPLVHIDAYRLGGPADLAAIGWDELLQNGEAIVAVEWAERIRDALPKHHVAVNLAHGPANTRIIDINDYLLGGAIP